MGSRIRVPSGRQSLPVLADGICEAIPKEWPVQLRDTVKCLYEVFCEVSDTNNGKDSAILKKYPESYKNEGELKSIPKFAFPCPLDKSFIQRYSFVLTSVDSKYSFCFCRYDPKVGSCLVILSHLPWHDKFYMLLDCLAQLLKNPWNGEAVSFLEALRIRPPMPGHTLTVKYDAGYSVFTITCPEKRLPSIPDNSNLTEYFSAVDTKCMAGLWAALLNERRIAVVASKPSRLSATVQAANATLFPMSWQHIFIPILPEHLVDYLLAPMPFLVGVPRAVMETVKMDIGDVVILDADANELKSPYNDLDSLPQEVVTIFKERLSNKNALGDIVSRAFLQALVCLIGGYHEAIRIETGQNITFDPEAFVKTRKHMRPFLRKMLQSQIFQQFIDERLDLLNSGRGFSDEFEMECASYSEEMGRSSAQKIKQQYKDWAKTVKKEGGAFLKTVKDKANPAVQTAVKTARQGGRNIRSAMKGFKTKIPLSSSRPSSVNTTEDHRYRYPISSSSSESLPSRDPSPRGSPPTLPLDLLTEMQSLLSNRTPAQKSATLSHNTDNYPVLTPMEKARTLSPSIPPRLPERPNIPARYPIISTRNLIDVSDAPLPPPRKNAPGSTNTFVSHITRNDVNGHSGASNPHQIHFTEVGKNSNKLKLCNSTDQRKTSLSSPQHFNPDHRPRPTPRPSISQPNPNSLSVLKPPVPGKNPFGVIRNRTQVSDTDLIQLDTSKDDSPLKLEDFDPLKQDSSETSRQPPSADSELLHEYGLDFSQLATWDYISDSKNPL